MRYTGRGARRAGLLAIAAATVALGTGCEAKVTTTQVAVHCTVDDGDPLAGAPLPEPRTHGLTTNIAPLTAAPGATVWVDVDLDDREGMFIVGPETTAGVTFPVPAGLTFVAGSVEDAAAFPGWSVGSTGTTVAIRYAAPPAGLPFIGWPRTQLRFTVDAGATGDIIVETYGDFVYVRHFQGITERAHCAPDDPATVIGSIYVNG